LSAPYTPFIADEIYTNVTATDPNAPDSVHLARWPEPDGVRADDALRHRMSLVRRLVVLGRSARTEAKIKVRQPLANAYLVVPADDYASIQSLEPMLKEELNVKAIVPSDTAGDLANYVVKPNFKKLGPRFGRDIGRVQSSISSADASALVAALDARGAISLDIDGETVDLAKDDLDIRIESRPGLQFVSDGPYGLALDVEITPELAAEGLAREVVRAVQELRKSSGLAVEDRIELWISGGNASIDQLRPHESYIAGEVLATSVKFEAGPEALSSAEAADGVTAALKKAQTA
ncbi:MAG: DUF5915 domain-containing protein, partial [Actinomycetota bacterium]